MALSIKKIKAKAKRIFNAKRLGPRNDIQRENLEEDNEKISSYSLNSVINDIKKNWVDIKKLNKKW